MVDIPINKTLHVKARQKSTAINRPSHWSNTVTVGIYVNNLRIRCIDSVGLTALAGVSVVITGAVTQTKTSDANGNVILDNTAAGTYNLVATKTAYLSASSSVVVSPGQTIQTTLSLELIPVSTVQGTVTNGQTGITITGATVTLPGYGTATTDFNGRYTFQNVANGSYNVTAAATGVIAGAQPLVLQGPGRTYGLDFALHPPLPGALIGTVRSTTNVLIPNVVVKVTKGTTVITTVTDSAGAYEILGLEAGTYAVEVTHVDYLPYTTNTTIAAGTTQTGNYTLTMITKPKIQGVITDLATGNPLAGVSILLEGTGVYKTTTSSATGTYEFLDVPRLTLSIKTSKAGWFPAATSVSVNADVMTKNIVMEEEPPPVSDLTGLIRETTTLQVLPNVTVRLLQAGVVKATTTTSTSGRYDFTGVVAANYTVTAVETPTHQTASATINILPGATGSLNLTMAPKLGIVRGTVTSDQTTPASALAGATVRLVVGGTTQTRTTTSTGAYEFVDILPGVYAMTFASANHTTVTANVTITAAQTTTKNQLLVRPAATLILTVKDQDTDVLLAGATIVTTEGGGVTTTVTTNAQGEATLTVRPGTTYFHAVTRTGYIPGNYQTDIGATGGAIARTLKLKQITKRLQGNITDSTTGAPVSVDVTTTATEPFGWSGTHRSRTSDYILLIPRAGTYSLTVVATGYITKTVTVVVTETDDTVWTHIALSPPAPAPATGEITGTVSSAVTGLPLHNAGVAVQVGTTSLGVLSDWSGKYRIPLVPSGSYQLSAQLTGYTTETRTGTLNARATVIENFLLSPTMATGWRYVLTWYDHALDMDSHLLLPDGNRVMYNQQVRYHLDGTIHAQLDIDDRDGSGPETTTVVNPTTGVYKFGVHAYSGGIFISTSGAVVHLYGPTGLLGSWEAPVSPADAKFWHVVNIEGTTVTPVNVLGTTFV